MKTEKILEFTPPAYVENSDVETLLTIDGAGAVEKQAALGRVLGAAYNHGHQIATTAAVVHAIAANLDLRRAQVPVALNALYRIGVAAGTFSLAYALGNPWALLAAIPLLFLSPKTKN